MQPLVSVIIPTRDRPSFLQEAIESVSRQTCKNYEIIVVVNGPDHPLIAETLKVAAAADCTVVRIDRSGIAVALNAGIKAATGEWLAFLDDDDAWEPNKLEVQLKVASHLRADVVFSDFTLFDGTTSVPNRQPRPPLSLSPREAMTLKNCGGGCSSTMVRRAAALGVGGFDESIVSPDWNMWMRLSWHYRVAWADTCTARVRNHANNTSKQISWAYWTLHTQFKALRTLPRDLRHLRSRIVLHMLKVAGKGTETYVRHRCRNAIRRLSTPRSHSSGQIRKA
jgi:glycosyltransferase involved in cell wall biosynthesis